jgi:hypothetical protein
VARVRNKEIAALKAQVEDLTGRAELYAKASVPVAVMPERALTLCPTERIHVQDQARLARSPPQRLRCAGLRRGRDRARVLRDSSPTLLPHAHPAFAARAGRGGASPRQRTSIAPLLAQVVIRKVASTANVLIVVVMAQSLEELHVQGPRHRCVFPPFLRTARAVQT